MSADQMSDKMSPETVLAIEAAIGGGSIALLSGGKITGGWHSDESLARSEELLVRIFEILNGSGTRKEALTRIAVSTGPGSYTGIRIGLATAMGLARALEIPCVGMSALKAIAATLEDIQPRIVIVPIGRNGYCWQTFDGPAQRADSRDIGTGNLADLANAIVEHPVTEVVAQTDAYSTLVADTESRLAGRRLIDAGRNIAAAVGAASSIFDDGLAPFYARDLSISSPGDKIDRK